MSKASVKVAADAAASAVGKSAGHRVAPYFVPPFIAALEVPAGEILHVTYGSSPWTTVGMTSLTCVLTGVAWHNSSSRSKVARAWNTAYTLVGMGWLTAAGLDGLSAPVDKAGGLAALAVIGSATIRRLTRNGGGDGQHSDSSLFAKVKLAGSKVVSTEVKANQVDALIEAGDEQTADDIRSATPAIAARLGVGATAVRAIPDPEHHGRATLSITPRDVLKTPPSWPGPIHVGGTMADPVNVGLYQDNEPQLLYFAGNPKERRTVPHYLITGSTGSGKTIGARNAFAGFAPRRESTIWVVDTRKPGQGLGPAAKMIDWYATTDQQARRLFSVLNTVIKARTEYLAAKGFDQWAPGCGINHLLLWLEEAMGPLADLDSFKDPATTARSAGITIAVSIQRPVFDNLPTSVRAMLNGKWAFGISDENDEKLVLPTSVLEAGANPAAWGASRPGMNYAAGMPWIPEERWSLPARTFYQPFGDELKGAAAMTSWVERCLPYRDPIDAITAQAAGAAWAERVSFMGSGSGPLSAVRIPAQRIEVSAAAAPLDAAPSPAAVDASAEDEELAEADQALSADLEELPEDLAAWMRENLAEVEHAVAEHAPSEEELDAARRVVDEASRRPLEVDEETGEEIAPLTDLAAAAGKTEDVSMTPKAARVHVLTAIQVLDAAEPGRLFKVKDIAEPIADTGLSPEWGRKLLRDLLKEGVLMQDMDKHGPGSYWLAPSGAGRAG
jgi:hypothetical protein